MTHPRKENAAQLLVRCLENEGIRYIFGIPGEEILELLDALSRSRSIKFVVTRHEQGAAFMADVYGRISTYPGVCLATLGPGATNLITGIADATLDRAPLVAITGQAGLDSVYKETHQYIDVVQMLHPITKWNARVERPDSIPEMVRKAFRLARLEKPGATHLELPEDVAAMPAPAGMVPIPPRRTNYPQATPATLESAAGLLRKAKRPIVLAGNGVVRRQATGREAAEALAEFVHQMQIPVTYTFMGKGSLDYRDPLALPAVGLQQPGADLDLVEELRESDLVLAIGYDLVEWAPSLWNPNRGKEIMHIDSTPAEIDGHYVPAIEVVGEIAESLRALAALCEGQPRPWVTRTARLRTLDDSAGRSGSAAELETFANDDSFPMKPQRAIWDLRQALGDDDIVVSDVGAHKLWLARYYPVSKPNTVVISNGFAAMGIAVPGGIAAKLANPSRKVVSLSGDGGFMMNSQELETARRLGTAFVSVVWSDQRYGAIELSQQRRFGRSFGVRFGNPDLVVHAQSYGLPSWRIEQAADFLPTLRQALELDEPSVIEVPVDYQENRRLAQPL
jgi:acetolactate synthase I/II/III large subunit